jgi:predicted PurR-regulated permease PerM
MDDAQLQIVISLINNAAGQLTEVGDQLADLGTQASEAAEQMSGALTAAEEAAADAAIAAASQWEASTGEITAAVESFGTDADAIFNNISDAALSAANNSSESWQSSLSELQELMAQTAETVEDDFAAISESAANSASSAGGNFGYFHNLIAGLFAERAGSDLTGLVQNVASAAAGNPEQVAQLTDEINQQKASIAVNEAELGKWNGTIAQVSAAHAKAAADIATSKDKIQELQQQLAPLAAEQQAGGDSAIKYDQAVQQLTTDWQAFLATIGTPFIASTTSQIAYIDQIVEAMEKWSQENPQLSQQIMTFLGILGPLLTVLGELAIGFAIVTLLLSSAAGPFLLFGAAIAIVAAAVIAFWPQIQQLFDYLNEKYGVVDTLRTSWDKLTTDFETKLMPDLEKLWHDLQPLMPYLETFAGFVAGVLVSSILTLSDSILKVVDAFVQLMDYATKVADFLTNQLEPILSTVKNLVAQFTGSSVGQAVGGAASSGLGSAILSMIPGLGTLANITSVHDAIITPSGVVQTDPADYLIATKTPGALGGAGSGNIQIFIQGGTYLDQNGASTIAAALASQINRQLKLRNFF